MRLLDRYFFSELFVPLLIGGATFLMMLVGNTLYTLLEYALQFRWPAAYIVRVLLFNIPIVLVYSLPVAAALGTSLAVGRLARDNELAALRSGGVSLARALAPVALSGAALTLFSGYVAERVVPWAWKEQQNIESVLFALPTSPVESSLTLELDSYTVTFATAQKTGSGTFRVRDVTLLERTVEAGAWPRVLTAKQADYSRSLWTLSDVTLHELEPDGRTRLDATAKTMELAQYVDFRRAALGLREEQLANLSFAELTRLKNDARRFGDRLRALQCDVNRFFKFGLPLMCLPCALCGAGLALRFARGGSFAGIVLSLVTVFLAWGAFTGAKFAALSGKVAPPLGAVLPALVFLLAGAHLIRRQE